MSVFGFAYVNIFVQNINPTLLTILNVFIGSLLGGCLAYTFKKPAPVDVIKALTFLKKDIKKHKGRVLNMRNLEVVGLSGTDKFCIHLPHETSSNKFILVDASNINKVQVFNLSEDSDFAKVFKK